MKFRGLFISNLPYILWFAFYFCLFWALLVFWGQDVQRSFAMLLAIYSVTIIIALSPLGEALFRFTEGIRPICTKREKDYLLPIFNEVYAQVKVKYPKISKNIQLYISDNMAPNAYALGNNTISVTRGLVEGMTAEQIKGIIGHEIGHIANGDTKALILRVIGNGLFSIAVICTRIILRIAISICNAMQFGAFIMLIANILGVVLVGIQICFEIGIFAINQIGDVILMANSRNNEYLADDFSYQVGYGDELISALYDLQNMHVNTKMSIIDRLKSTHPYLADRIRRLEEKPLLHYAYPQQGISGHIVERNPSTSKNYKKTNFFKEINDTLNEKWNNTSLAFKIIFSVVCVILGALAFLYFSF